MKWLNWLVVFGVGIGTYQPVSAFDLNDCIINGMKGVSSDVAARQVRYACDQKHRAYKGEQLAKVEKEFGQSVDVSMAEQSKFFELAGPGKHSIQISSREAARALTFLRLEVSPAPGGQGTTCDPLRVRVFAYKTLIKPGATAKLVFPVAAESNCITILSLYARPTAWSDVSFSSTIEPLAADPFDRVK